MQIIKWSDKYSIDCRLKYNSTSTQENYLSQVKSFLWHFKDEIEPKSIPTEKIKLWLLEAKTVNTRKHRLCAVKSFYELTVGMPMKLDRIPYPKAEKKLPRIINQDELKSKIFAIQNKKHKAILALAYACSLRVSEVVNLKISDVNGKDNILCIREAKGKKDRHTKVSDNMLEILREYFKEYKPKEFLFEGQTGGKYSTRSCEEIYHKYIDTETSFHNLRHSGITAMIEAGTNQIAVQVAVGHTRASTTAGYYHVSPKFLAQIHSPI